MKRRGAGIINVVAGLIVGLVVGLGAMYVLAPSIIGSTVSTTTGISVSTVVRSTTVTSTVAGSGPTTVTETTTLPGTGSTVTTTTTVGAGARATITFTVTNLQTTTIDAAQGFFGGAVFVDIAPGTGSNQSLNFSPSTITVVLGMNSTVIWTNHDSVQHRSPRILWRSSTARPSTPAAHSGIPSLKQVPTATAASSTDT